jgi:hypothetical protein
MQSYSQQVIFCEDVDASGNPKATSDVFTIGQEGGFFKILVRLNKQVSCKKVIFDIYKIEKGKEIFDNTLRMDIRPELTWFFKEITFFKQGDFHVYIYDERDKLLGVGKVTIKFR